MPSVPGFLRSLLYSPLSPEEYEEQSSANFWRRTFKRQNCEITLHSLNSKDLTVTTGCGIDRKKHLAVSKVSGSGRIIGHLLTQKIQEREQGSLKLVSRVRDSESLLSPEWRNNRYKSVSYNRNTVLAWSLGDSMWRLGKGAPEGRSLEGRGRWLGWGAEESNLYALHQDMKRQYKLS